VSTYREELSGVKDKGNSDIWVLNYVFGKICFLKKSKMDKFSFLSIELELGLNFNPS